MCTCGRAHVEVRWHITLALLCECRGWNSVIRQQVLCPQSCRLSSPWYTAFDTQEKEYKNDKCHSITAPSMLVLYLLSVLCKGFLVVSVHLVSSSLVKGCSCLWSSEDAAGPACFLLERTLTSAVSTEAGLLLGYPSRMGWYLIADFLLGTAGLCLPSVVLTVFMWVATQHQTKQRPIKVPESNPRDTQVEPQGHVESLYSSTFNNHISNYYQDFFLF